jgi:Flp pilus assembly protein TadG
MAGLRKTATAFGADDRGNIAIMFGAIIFAILAAGGAAIDLLRIDKARTALSEAGDAALIAAARYKGANPAATDAKLTEIAAKLFAAQMQTEPEVLVHGFDIVYNGAASSFRLNIDAEINLLFMGIFGNKMSDLDTTAEAKLGKPPYIELAMALDVTGSMNSNGKLSTLKAASKDLIETLFGYDGATVKIGVVPFAQYVNVGTDHAAASWLSNPGGAWAGCVGSRPYPSNIEDSNFSAVQAPGLNGVACPPALLPLTDDKANVSDMIDGLSASGWTFIPAGLGWGWSLLTPTEPFTGAIAFEDLADVNGVKALMVMTDGANTRAPDYPTHDSPSAALANSLTSEICTNIKAEKIVVYTVAFEVTDTTIKDILRGCATDAAYYFDAKDADALAAAFNSIGASLRNISLSK